MTTTNTQHTPAPWNYKTKGEITGFVNDKTLVIFSESHGAICEIDGNNPHFAEHEANAKLIARAPELLKENEQLKGAILKEAQKFAFCDIQRNELQALNAELLEALKLAQQYVNVFILRNEDPLVGDMIKTHSFKIESAIAKAEGKEQAPALTKVNSVEEAKKVLHDAGYFAVDLWTLGDITMQAGEKGDISQEAARLIANAIEANHDAINGINWDCIDSAIDEYLEENY